MSNPRSKKFYSVFAAFALAFCFTAFAIYFTQSGEHQHATTNASTSMDFPETFAHGSFEAAQQVFDNRCIQCHSCNTAPCQLKLTSYEGARRGLTQILVYDPARTSEIAPTRLGTDAHGEAEWRKRGFYPVATLSVGGAPPILSQVLKSETGAVPETPVLDSNTCPLTTADLQKMLSSNSSMRMPYGLPAITEGERSKILDWVSAGAQPPKPKTFALTSAETSAMKSWQSFLNQPELKNRLVARYIFEHLFLAHIYFDSQSTNFHRLIRSRTLCGTKASEIATRRPNDDPGATVYYCFEPITETIVEKTHLPYLLDAAKLTRIKSIFFGEHWNVAGWPGYSQSSNPFTTFASIPVKARYEFLLEDAKYHVATFIKGPVCNGTGAVNAIDEHFFVTFVDPASELQILSPKLARESAPILQLPAETGGGIELLLSPHFLNKYIRYEKNYKDLKEVARNQLFPRGYSLKDIWDGRGTNANALLTVFRHSENADVLQGFQGGFANSIFVLDYPLFERLVYNLAVDFDVFGAVSHQLYTRTYMGLIRREAEDNLLNFLPPDQRESLYNRWEGWLPQASDRLLNYAPDTKFPTQIQYQPGVAFDQQFIVQLLQSRYDAGVVGQHDFVNTRYLNIAKAAPEASSVENTALRALKTLSQVPAKQLPFVKFMPDSAIIIVQNNEKTVQLYTMIRNKAHSTIGKLFRESKAREVEEDNLVFVPGLATSYPNYYYVVSAASLQAFVDDAQTVVSPDTFGRFRDRWGVSRINDSFWQISDSVQQFLKASNPTEFGYLDYSRYGL